VQAAAAVLIVGRADIVTAADEGDLDLVLLHLIADPATANHRDQEYDSQPYTTYVHTRIHLRIRTRIILHLRI
jgi:hypothetical protein